MTTNSSPPSPPDQGALPVGGLAQRLGHGLQDGVTCGVPVRVVDPVEPVEVQHHQDRSGADRRLGLFEEAAPVQHIGERVVGCLVLEL